MAGGSRVDRGATAGLPSASALARAASTAAMKASRAPRVSSTAIAASVVPPGEVTMRRSSAGESGDAAASAAEPATVCSARRRATAGGSPIWRPASMQRLEEQEDVGRARARQRRHRVELRFLADPDQLAGRREQRRSRRRGPRR